MYVAVKGGERAIDNAHQWLAEERRGDTTVPELTPAQIREQMTLAVNRVMAEGSLYDPDLAALAIKQARGDLIEAIFLIRAYRTTLPRFGGSRPVDTGKMRCERRISATFKDLPGGQVLGPTFDYTHRFERTPRDWRPVWSSFVSKGPTYRSLAAGPALFASVQRRVCALDYADGSVLDELEIPEAVDMPMRLLYLGEHLYVAMRSGVILRYGFE